MTMRLATRSPGLVVLLALACTEPAPETTTEARSAIVGGSAAIVTSYPAVVAVRVNGGLCSGVVIAPEARADSLAAVWMPRRTGCPISRR